MKFIKKNQSTIVAIFVFILVLAGIFAVKSVLSSDEEKAIYGTRLDGRDDVEISTETKNKVKSELESQSSNVDVSIAGRIINIIVNANSDVTLEQAKELGSKAVAVFSDTEKEYYDIQIFIKNEDNTSQFPIIGYMHHGNDEISWTKDRSES